MKKRVVLIAVLMTLLLFGGCSKEEFANGELYVYNWGEYIDLEVIDMFEELYDIDVIYDEFEENEDMYPIIENGSVVYDVVCPSDYMISKMIANDMLAPLNYENIPNIQYLDPLYLKQAEEFDKGNQYAVPYCWGTVGIIYNTKMVEEEITSWSALFDEKYAGNILMIESVRDGFSVAMNMLGYSINTVDKEQIEEAKELLKTQYPVVQAYVVDQVRDKMISGEAAMGVIYSGEALYTITENEDLAYVVPEEGSNVWLDCWVIPSNCQSKENAEKWINFMCDPEIALKNFEYIMYSTPNKAAKELIEDEELKNSEVAFPSEEVLSRCSTYQYLGEEMDSYYIRKWNEIKLEQ